MAVPYAGIAVERNSWRWAGVARCRRIGGRFPLEEVGRALEMIDGRQAIGKIVLEARV